MLIYIFYHQDALENLFSHIRGKNYQSTNHSAQEFRLIIRQILVDTPTIHNREANCEEDIIFYFLILLIYQKLNV